MKHFVVSFVSWDARVMLVVANTIVTREGEGKIKQKKKVKLVVQYVKYKILHVIILVQPSSLISSHKIHHEQFWLKTVGLDSHQNQKIASSSFILDQLDGLSSD